MSIFKDIEKATQIPSTDDNATFVPRKKDKKDKSRRKLNKRRPPPNANIYDDDEPDEEFNRILAERSLNEYEIACSIKLANGGVSYSNQALEEYWRTRPTVLSTPSPDDFTFQKRCSIKDDIKFAETKTKNEEDTSVVDKEDTSVVDKEDTSVVDKEDTSVVEKEDTSVVDKEDILKKSKLYKNVALAALIRSNVIPIERVQIPNRLTNMEHKSRTEEHKASGSSVDDRHQNESKMQLIECPEDSEILMHPLQARGGIDENKHKDIDFTVPRIGKKKVTTPIQYYIDEADDSFFTFKKKNSKSKKN